MGVWFITTIETIEKTDLGFPLFGDVRTWGFYFDKELAIRALHNNLADMREFLYDYAVIEEYYDGIIQSSGERQWFQWNENKKGFFEIDEPNEVKNLANFALS